jgi:hypothetical protein
MSPLGNGFGGWTGGGVLSWYGCAGSFGGLGMRKPPMNRIIAEIETEIRRLQAARALLAGKTNARKVGRRGTRMVRRKHIVVTPPRGVRGRNWATGSSTSLVDHFPDAPSRTGDGVESVSCC